MQLAEGDIIITFNKTLDLMRQVQDMLFAHFPESPLIPILREARYMMRRGVVEQIYNVGFGVLKDELEAVTVDGLEKAGEARPPLLSELVTLDSEEEEEEAAANAETQPPATDNRRRFGRKGSRRPFPTKRG
jgi:hypothetical protein